MGFTVFTGDLIGSRTASDDAVRASMAVLRDTAGSLGEAFGYDPRFTRLRGDGWQILLTRSETLYEMYLALVANLSGHDTCLATSISIGIGSVDFAGSGNLSDASGTAFVASGDMLQQLSASSGQSRVAISGHGAQDWQLAILRLTDWLAKKWSARQAEAVALYLLRRDLNSNADRAAALGITRQAFDARFRSSGFPALSEAREAFWNYSFEAAK